MMQYAVTLGACYCCKGSSTSLLCIQWHNKKRRRGSVGLVAHKPGHPGQEKLKTTGERRAGVAPSTPPARNVKLLKRPSSSYIEIFRDHARTAHFYHLDRGWRIRHRHKLTVNLLLLLPRHPHSHLRPKGPPWLSICECSTFPCPPVHSETESNCHHTA
jgi:hypothetical protein